MADVAYNPQTGEALRLDAGKWVPTQVAKNDKTGEVMAFNGADWAKVTGGAPERGVGENVARATGLTAQGFNDSVANFLGTPGDIAKTPGPGGLPGFSPLPNDIIANVARKVGVNLPIGTPGSADIKSGMDYAATIPRRLAAAISGGSVGPLTAPQSEISSRVAPESTTERFAYGSGRGLGDVATGLGTAGVVRNLAPADSVTRNLTEALMKAPGTQIASSAIGAGVGEASDSPIAGLVTSLGVAGGMEGTKEIGRRLLSPQAGNLTAEQQRLARVAAAEGIPLTTGQQTGSKPIQLAEAALEKLPISGKMRTDQLREQRDAFTAAALKRAGIEANAATPEVLTAGKESLGRTFDKTRPAAVKLDDQLTEDMIGIGEKWWPKLDATKKPIVEAYINQITDPKLGGQMAGDIYQETRSILRNQADSLKNSDYATFRALKDVRNALDKAAERSMSPEQFSAFQDTNRKYANLKTIMKAMEGAGAETASGTLSPARLRMAANQSAKGNYSTGAGDLNELARVGETFVKPQVPDSGTAQRLFYQSLLTGGTGLAGAGIPALAASIALPPVAHKLLQSDAMRHMLTRERLPPGDMKALLAAVLSERMQGMRSPPKVEGR